MPHIYRIDSRINIVKKLIEPFQLQLNEIVESVKIQGMNTGIYYMLMTQNIL